VSFKEAVGNNNNTEGVNQRNGPMQHTLLDSQILEIIMNSSQDTIYFKDKESKFIANSKAHALQFGYNNPKDIIGKSDFDFFPKEFAQATFQDEKKIIETGIPILGKTEMCVTPEGNPTWYSVSKYPIFDDNRNIIGIWGSSRNITQLKLAEQELARLNKELEITNLKLRKLSDLDGLSELYNQRRFHEVLKETLYSYQSKRVHSKDATFCVMLIDIDCFKMINDTYGHPTGDTAIKYIADLIQKNVREKDICFRCGGDEFAVILFDTNLEAGMNMAKRLREIIGTSRFVHENEAITITVSLGIDNYQDEDSINKLLSKIDKKLYHSKQQGKNQVS
jgi:diguanylate cyclase (GGDEF)-like protein/PAS domain S-box-containing protein